MLADLHCLGTDYLDGRVNEEAAVEPATIDRIQRMIDAEATERCPRSGGSSSPPTSPAALAFAPPGS
jgi:hypothetical protein